MSLIDDYRKALCDAMNNDALSIADGGASSYDDYRYRVGVRRGLRKAMQIFEDTIKDIQERDEEF